jgi:hypothetical protein
MVHDCEYVNPDAIAQDELGDWNDAETVEIAPQEIKTRNRELLDSAFLRLRGEDLNL